LPSRPGRADADAETGNVKAQTGRVLGPRARRTRRRLLEATADLLRERSVLDISVVEIARSAETSAATFYHYFKDVEEAALELAREAATDMPALLELIDGSWEGTAGLERARALAGGFLDHWESHRAVLMIRNLAADRGDPRFQAARRLALSPLIEHLAARIAEAQETGHVARSLHPFAAAAAMASLLETLSAHTAELTRRGVGRSEWIETTAGIVFQVVTGRAPA